MIPQTIITFKKLGPSLLKIYTYASDSLYTYNTSHVGFTYVAYLLQLTSINKVKRIIII